MLHCVHQLLSDCVCLLFAAEQVEYSLLNTGVNIQQVWSCFLSIVVSHYDKRDAKCAAVPESCWECEAPQRHSVVSLRSQPLWWESPGVFSSVRFELEDVCTVVGLLMWISPSSSHSSSSQKNSCERKSPIVAGYLHLQPGFLFLCLLWQEGALL